MTGCQPDVRLIYLVKQVEMASRAQLDAICRGFGITVPQYTALSVLARHPGMSSAHLARRSFVTPLAANEMVAALERKELIERCEDSVNRRILRISLTNEGAAVLATCDTEVDCLEERMLMGVSEQDTDWLRAALHRCRDQLAPDGKGDAASRSARPGSSRGGDRPGIDSGGGS